MWGDLKVWSGTQEVTVVPWWYRFYRWITFADSLSHYKRVAEMMGKVERLQREQLVNEAIYGGGTTGGHSRRQRDSAGNLRELKTGEHDGV